jgi:selenocysteine-specific elongation factor
MQAERERIARTVREFHQRQPLVPGIARQDLRGEIPAFVFEALIAESKDVVAEGEIVRSRAHRVVLREDEEQARAKIEGAFEAAGLAVPALAEVMAASGLEAGRARPVLQILLREKRLVRVSEDLVFHCSAIERLRGLLAAHKGERFAVPAFKEWTGISRKYAIPLLEFLDREKVTRRDGDQRVIL